MLNFVVTTMLCALALCFISPSHANAYNTISMKKIVNGKAVTGGHEEITNWSYRIAEKEGYSKSINKSMLLSGTTDEDEVVTSNALHHFYNPGTGEALFDAKNGKVFGTAKFHAKRWYDAAVKFGSSYSLSRIPGT